MIHLLVGNTGAGKTTYGQKLETSLPGFIMSIDEYNRQLYLMDKSDDDGLEWMLERIDRVEDMVFSNIIKLEKLGVDSILDLGFSKQSHRQKFYDFASKQGYQCQLHFLDVDAETRFERINQRNQEQGESFSFHVSREDFEFMESWFETPEETELNGAIHIK